MTSTLTSARACLVAGGARTSLLVDLFIGSRNREPGDLPESAALDLEHSRAPLTRVVRGPELDLRRDAAGVESRHRLEGGLDIGPIDGLAAGNQALDRVDQD